MVSRSRSRQEAFTRRQLAVALVIGAVALAIGGLRIPIGSDDKVSKEAATQKSGASAPAPAAPAVPKSAAALQHRLSIMGVETRHLRSGGLRPGDAFDAIVTVRNHGARAATIRVDVVRTPDDVLPFRPRALRIPPGRNRQFKLHLTADARHIHGREYRRTIYIANEKGHSVTAFVDATPADNRHTLLVPVGLYIDLELTTVKPGPFAIDLKDGRYRASRQSYEVTITNRGTARYETGARFDLSLHAEPGSRRLTRWSRQIDRAIEPGQRITITGSFTNRWQHPPWIKEPGQDRLFDGPALPGFPMRLIAILRMPLNLDPARRNNERDTRFMIGVDPTRREKQRLIYDPVRVRSGRIGFTD